MRFETINIKMKKIIIALLLSILTVHQLAAQNNSQKFDFENPIMVDSTSTIVIPISYNSNYFSNSKIADWEDVYANLIFYNFATDSNKRLFENNTYILNIYNRFETFYNKKPNKNFTKQHFFCRVKNVDYNNNGKIDEYDPAILYVCDIYGNNLRALTLPSENVESFEIFEKLNFAMIKIQRDANNDYNFKNSENDYYYVKLDLKTLTFGKKIEIK
jgi:hypothetical protein